MAKGRARPTRLRLLVPRPSFVQMIVRLKVRNGMRVIVRLACVADVLVVMRVDVIGRMRMRMRVLMNVPVLVHMAVFMHMR